MNYELALKLKKAGFSQIGVENSFYIDRNQINTVNDKIKIPSLEELIEACGDNFHRLEKDKNDSRIYWVAIYGSNQYLGLTSYEAVANLWLALNINKNL